MSFGEQPIVKFSKGKSRTDPFAQRNNQYHPHCGLCLGAGKIRSSLHHSGFIACKSCNGTGWSESRKSK